MEFIKAKKIQNTNGVIPTAVVAEAGQNWRNMSEAEKEVCGTFLNEQARLLIRVDSVIRPRPRLLGSSIVPDRFPKALRLRRKLSLGLNKLVDNALIDNCKRSKANV